MTFQSKLAQQAQSTGNIACLGLDPLPEKIPYDLSPIEKTRKFFLNLLETMTQQAVRPAMVKPNIAFFERLGIPGLTLLKEIIGHYRKAGYLIAIDAKRGDIGATSAAYAEALFQQWQADAVTVSPYLGKDSLEPYARWGTREKGFYILLRTTNPGASEIQEMATEKGPFYMRLLDLIMEWNLSGTGLVVGGTQPEALATILARLREKNNTFPLLIPGIGTQGGDSKMLMKILRDSKTSFPQHRVSSSSSILYAWEKHGGDPVDAALEALKKFINTCQV